MKRIIEWCVPRYALSFHWLTFGWNREELRFLKYVLDLQQQRDAMLWELLAEHKRGYRARPAP